jgi:hypothetical protein
MLLVWPVVAVVGFVLLATLVIALATSSTAQYEFERNRVQGQGQQAAAPAVPAAVGAAAVSGGSGGRPAGDPSLPAAVIGGAGLQEERLEQAAAVSLAAHPAGKRVLGQGTPPAWWLVEDLEDGWGEQVVAGPFPDRIEADWAALSGGLASGRAVHGVLRADGRLVRRQTPEERAWLSDLGDQLDRLPDDWDGPLSDEDELVTLVVELASALVEAGLPLHDCTGQGPAGGVCLTPEPGSAGVLVSWHQHDRMSHEQVRGAEVHAAVQRTMNSTVAECLRQLGFDVEPYGSTGCSLVTVDQRQG